MVIDLEDIQKIRKKLGITQKELAKIAGVSQSLIAKIENKLIEPKYKNAMKIINALSNFNKDSEKTVEEVMTKKIISAKPEDDIRTAILLMKRNGISQIPVMDDGICLGIVTETDILKTLPKKDLYLKEIMDECPPIVAKETKVEVIAMLLRYYPLILIGEQGKFIGVVTKTDLISAL